MAKAGLDIHSLVKSAPPKLKDKNLKGMPLNGLWIPFFTATNVARETNLSAGALGAPMQLVRTKAGAIKLKEVQDADGKTHVEPVYAPNREVRTAATAVMDNFAFGLQTYAATIQKTRPEEWKAQVEAAQKAGEEIRAHETVTLSKVLAKMQAESETPTESPTETPKVETPTQEKELVAA